MTKYHVLLGALLLVGAATCCTAEDVLDAKTINLVIREAETKGQTLDVEVVGLGESDAPVDHVSINIFVEVVDKTDQVKPKLQSDLDVKTIIKAAEHRGVETRDIDGTHVSIGPRRVYDGDKEEYVRVGYKAERRVFVTLRDLSQLDDMLTDIVKIPSAQIEAITFGSEKIADAKEKALHLAVADAKQKAQQMASAFGMEVGKIMEINPSSRFAAAAVRIVELGKPIDLPTSSFLKNTIPVKSEVEVRYELVRK